MRHAERRAVLLLLGLAVLGQGVQYWRGKGNDAAMPVSVRGGSRVSPDAQRVAAVEANRPLTRGEQVDLNHATAQQLTRLPGVGPALAERIVDNRNQVGPFPSVGALARVRGIGVATVRRLEPFLHIRGGEDTAPGGARVDLNRATAAELERLPGLGPAKAKAIVADREVHGRYDSLGALLRVPGIGPKLVARLAPVVRVP